MLLAGSWWYAWRPNPRLPLPTSSNLPIILHTNQSSHPHPKQDKLAEIPTHNKARPTVQLSESEQHTPTRRTLGTLNLFLVEDNGWVMWQSNRGPRASVMNGDIHDMKESTSFPTSAGGYIPAHAALLEPPSEPINTWWSCNPSHKQPSRAVDRALQLVKMVVGLRQGI